MRKIVALVDWNWKGHHPTYFTNYAVALAAAGADVVPFCGDPEDFSARLAKLDLESGVADRIGRPEQVGRPLRSRFRPVRWRGAHDAIRFFGGLARRLHAWERAHRRKIDLVFFSCIYDFDFFDFPAAGLFFRYPWAGLYLHSFGFRSTTSPIHAWIRNRSRPQRFLQNRNLVAIGTLDEGIMSAANTAIGRDRCLLFPDLADLAPADQGPETVGGKLRLFAGDRPVVTLCGSLYEQRGVDMFLRTAMANPQWAFALVGEMPDGSDKVKPLLDDFLQNHPHAFHHPDRIPDGPLYNGVVASSDVIWNVHIDWPGSSNTLTKAAAFAKPVLVSSRHLLGERAKKFRLGEVCDETSVESMSQGLAALLQDPVGSWGDYTKPAWREYLEAHSFERLETAMRKLISYL